MAHSLSNLDWSLVQSFIAVAEEGSLTAAASRLGQTQPTLGRRIQAMEERLELTLFTRQRRGLALTEVGSALLGPAKDMQAAAARLSLAAAGQSQTLTGTVRITTSMVVAHHVMPALLARITREEPQIEIELQASDASDNLLFHEADIAVRMYRPTQLDVVTRHLGDMRIGLFAAQSYLDRAGIPRSLEALAGHDWVGYDRNQLIIQGMRSLGWEVDRSFFKTRCDSQTTYWELVRAGCGIGVGPAYVAAKFPEVREVLPEVKIDPLPIWLSVPQALRNTPRVRRIFDVLAEELTAVTKA